MDKIENPAERTVYALAFQLIDFAKKAGLVVTIETVPLEPLAMGNYKLTTEVRSARHAAAVAITAPRLMPIMRTGKSIPFSVLNEEWAKRNHYQSLDRLAERGGLGPTEALAIIEKRPWHKMDDDKALTEVMRHVEERTTKGGV